MKAIMAGKTGAVVAIGLCVLVNSARALPTTLDVGLSSSLVVGEIIPPAQSPPGQEARDQAMINSVVTMYNAGTPSSSPYFISGNVFPKPLPSAVTTGDVITAKSGISFATDGNVTITLTGTGYHYLIAVYDGQNSGGVVWNITGLAAGTTIEIPQFAQPNTANTDLVDGKYGITTWSLFNPGTSRVPDGGMTLALLGTSLCGLGLFARRRK